MVEVDLAMTEDFRILLVQMMEHAGRHLAYLARARFLAVDARGREVVILAGFGGNGGGALVCARRLAGWGAKVVVAVAVAVAGPAASRTPLTVWRTSMTTHPTFARAALGGFVGTLAMSRLAPRVGASSPPDQT
ncbi:MAG: hypothetical protein EHM13_02345 [Acidobacteria bacterium]|nr:MAG: hypothetical protein EHM13_02345 [Acidobacteriota bacterium]